MTFDAEQQEAQRVLMERATREAAEAIRATTDYVSQDSLTYGQRLFLWENIYTVARRSHETMQAYMEEYGVLPEAGAVE